MLADELDYVVGVDTHRDQHVLAVVAAPTGALIAQRSVASERARLRRGLRFAERHAPAYACGRSKAPAITAPAWPASLALAARSCTRSAAAAVPSGGCAAKTTRSTRPARPARHSRANTPAMPRSGQRQEALRVLLLARRSAVDVRRRRARPTAQRDRDRTREPPRGAAAAARRRADPPLQPLPPLELAHTRPARDGPRAPLTRPADPGSDPRGRPSSNARSSLTSARSLPSSSTSRASDRSSPRN